MPTEATIYQVLATIFRDAFQRDVTLRPEFSARDIHGWDSLKQIMIIIATEERFGIRVNSREMDNLQTVGDLVRLIQAKSIHGEH